MIIDGKDACPFVVAEIGASHNGSLERCKELIWQARQSGADGVKLQCYTPDEITIYHNGPEFTIKSGAWWGYNLYQLYQEAHTPREWFPELFRYARELGIVPFASVFSTDGVKFLETLNCPAYKIASFEAIDLEIIDAAALTGKPLMVSTGMMSESEYWDAHDCAMEAGLSEENICMMHCVSAYPCPPEEAALGNMLKGDGLSDHTRGIEAAIIAATKGARVIEKHLTMPRLEPHDDALDDAFAVTPAEFTRMVDSIRTAQKMLSSGRGPSEKEYSALRRSLYAVRPIVKGEPFTRDNVRSIRPANGLNPSMLSLVLEKKAPYDIPYGTPLTMEMIGDE